MNKIYKYVMFVLLLGFGTACDEGFDELNINPTAAVSVNPAFVFNNAVLSSGYPGAMIYEIGAVQQIVAPFTGVLSGANFNLDNRGATGAVWGSYYPNTIKYTVDVIEKTKDDPTRANLYHMARILQARAYMILVDTYGYVPYTEGVRGNNAENPIFFPKYDNPVAIYDDLIKELTEATAALGASGAIVETADVLYFGNINKWKKFGNSLLLRAGMRLSNVNPTKAASTVAAAFAGGVIMTNADNAAIIHDANYTNGIGNVMNANEAANYYLTNTFVDFLKATNDPRLGAFAVRYMGALSGGNQIPANANFDPAVQNGLPMGTDLTNVGAAAASRGLAGLYEFSQLDRLKVGSRFAPTYLVTASQTQLLLAEARHRGWITAGTVAGYYEAGIRAHMAQLPEYNPTASGLVIAPSAIDAFIAENALASGTELEQINEQYWISSLLNGPEAWANVRRSGFPTLPVNPFPGREANFINRLTYPQGELNVNTENVQAAIAAQGPDDLNTKIFWAK